MKSEVSHFGSASRELHLALDAPASPSLGARFLLEHLRATRLLAQQPIDTLLHLPLHLTGSQRQAGTLVHTSEEVGQLHLGLLAKDGKLILRRPVGQVGTLVRRGGDAVGVKPAATTAASSADSSGVLGRARSTTSMTEGLLGTSGEAAAGARGDDGSRGRGVGGAATGGAGEHALGAASSAATVAARREEARFEGARLVFVGRGGLIALLHVVALLLLLLLERLLMICEQGERNNAQLRQKSSTSLSNSPSCSSL